MPSVRLEGIGENFHDLPEAPPGSAWGAKVLGGSGPARAE